MSEEEVEIFHGDRPPEHGEGAKKSKPKAKTIIAKADPAPTAEPDEVPTPEGLAETEADDLADEHAEAAEAIEAQEPEYHFEIDPESLWTMPPDMQERMSNLSSASAATNERLDEQEKAIAKVNKALKQLV
jgi:hypothetical protein